MFPIIIIIDYNNYYYKLLLIVLKLKNFVNSISLLLTNDYTQSERLIFLPW